MEILFDNPIIVIILIAIASSLFKKKKRDDDQNTRRPSMGEKQRKAKGQFQEIKDIFQEVTRTLQEETNPPVQRSREVVHQRKAVEEVSMVNSQPADISNSKEEFVPNKDAQKKTERAPIVDDQTLVNAVIWSEILGPPRARKTHYKQRRS